MKILVTGAAGFIGSMFVERIFAEYSLEQSVEKVIVLDALTYAGNLGNLKNVLTLPNFSFVHGDITDRKLVERLVKEVDCIVHFAAESHVDRSILDGSAFVSTNVLGTQILLQASVGANLMKFVHVSTDEVYGSIELGSWDEECILAPNSPYSASKASSDLLALSYYRTFNIPVVITRCSNNYGPRQNDEKLIPMAIKKLLRRQKIPVYGDGLNIRDWIHVSDHCDAIWKVLTGGLPGQIFNISGENELTNLDILRKIISLMDLDESFIEFVQDRKGHDRRYSVDDSKIKAILSYAPRININSGLAETIEWYRNSELLQ